MADSYEIVYSPEVKAENDNKQVEENVADHNERMSQNPMYKVIIPQYMYKPAWGFPRYQPLQLLRSLGKNAYASSAFKAVKDIIIDTPWNIVTREGVDETEELKAEIDRLTLLFKRPNPEETFSSFMRKVIDDIFKYDSGIINKIYNPFGEVIQLRAAPGDTFKKNPNRHGYLDERDGVILQKTLTGAQQQQLIQASSAVNSGKVQPDTRGNLDNSFVQKSAFQFYTQFIDRAAYFQFVNSVASQIPIAFGKKELCWLTTNPSTDNVYTNGSPLEDTIDIILTLVYGSKYNLDFYANGNTPEGIINAVGASKKDLKKIKDQLNHSIKTPKDGLGMSRRIGYRMPVVNMDNIAFVKLNLTSSEMEILAQQDWFLKVFFMRLGLNADVMGFTSDSNRATGVQQDKSAQRKAIKPYYTMFEECFTYEIIADEDVSKLGSLLEFKFDFYDATEQKIVRDLQEQEIKMGINSAQKIADEEGIDFEELKEHLQDGVEFDAGKESAMFEANNPEVPIPDKGEENLQKEKEEPETKSFTSDLGGEGTTDAVMVPLEKPKKPLLLKKIIQQGNKWVVTSESGEVLGTHDTREEAIDQLQAVEANKSETKGHAGVPIVSSFDDGHTHIATEGDQFSSVDDEHKHYINWETRVLELAGERPHTHTLPKDAADEIIKQDAEVKAEEDPITDKEQKELILESPLEKVMKLFIKEIDEETKEIVKKVEE